MAKQISKTKMIMNRVNLMKKYSMVTIIDKSITILLMTRSRHLFKIVDWITKKIIFFIKYLQEKYIEWKDKKIVDVSQNRVSDIIDLYFSDDDMNKTELPEELIEEPL